MKIQPFRTNRLPTQNIIEPFLPTQFVIEPKKNSISIALWSFLITVQIFQYSNTFNTHVFHLSFLPS
jgi:hypothetical protein